MMLLLLDVVFGEGRRDKLNLISPSAFSRKENYHKIFAMFQNSTKLIFYEALMN